MRAFVITLLAGVVLAAPAVHLHRVDITKIDVLELLEGVFEGMAIDLKIEDLEECAINTDKIATDLDEAFENFKKHTFDDVKKALEEIGQAFKLVPQDLRECEAAPEESIKAFEKVLEIFASPTTLVWDLTKTLVLDGKEIYHELDSAKEDWDNGDYRECGKNLGEAFFKFVDY